MAAERASLNSADADALGRILAELAFSAYVRQHRGDAEGRAPFQSDARPPEAGREEKQGGTSTRRPQRILQHS